MATEREAHRSHSPAIRNFLPGSYERSEFMSIGQISLALSSNWCEPGTDKAEDVAAAERCMEFGLGWFANPIFRNGDYPEVMKTLIASRSAAEGLNASRLPVFTPEEIANNKGTFDFFALNHYTTVQVFNPIDKQVMVQNFGEDKEIYYNYSSSWPRSGSDWLFFVPFGMRKILNYMKNKYDNPPIIITENGWSDNTGTVNDIGRVRYYKYYINNVLKAYQDGCKVIGYTAWSIMDNFEWLTGYTQKFGLHHVNFSDPQRARTPKESAVYYASVISNNGFPSYATSPPTIQLPSVILYDGKICFSRKLITISTVIILFACFLLYKRTKSRCCGTILGIKVPVL